MNSAIPRTCVTLLLALTGCLSRPDFSRISIGMTKDEVIAKLGKPRNRAVNGDTEFFTYEGEASYADGRLGGEFYYVRFLSGKVLSFGNKGDFDSTKDPALNINLKQQRQPTGSKDVAGELKKLQTLRDENLISEELQRLRQKILDNYN